MHQIELWALIPFALMLASIAVLPLVAEHWWENNLHKSQSLQHQGLFQ